jgi:hypothetical protein
VSLSSRPLGRFPGSMPWLLGVSGDNVVNRVAPLLLR